MPIVTYLLAHVLPHTASIEEPLDASYPAITAGSHSIEQRIGKINRVADTPHALITYLCLYRVATGSLNGQ